jgi:hypothetical protein
MIGNQENALLKMIITNMKNYTKNIHPCPFRKREPLEFKEFQMDTATLPMMVPLGSYRFDTHLHNGKNTTYLKAFVYLTVKNPTPKSKNIKKG